MKKISTRHSRTAMIPAVAPVAELEHHINSPYVTFIIMSALLGAGVYLAFLLQPAYRGDLFPYLIVIIAEVFLVLHGVISFWTILNGRINPRNFGYHITQDSLFGMHSAAIHKEIDAITVTSSPARQMVIRGKVITVDVFIPVYGESLSDIRETALAAKALYGKHETYILDDGKSDQVKALARELHIGYIRRPTNEHAKAGNINYALTKTSGEYFVIFDADFVADPHFIVETIPFFENKRMAFVQTPQYYRNQQNFISTAASYMQHVFYSLVQVGKNKFNAAFCVGTNVIFRRSAIEKIGGMYTASKSEDIWTSMLLHEHRYQSIYINKVLAVGKTPETIKAYSQQQLRWATGSFEIFFHRNPLLNKHLTFDQRIQYFATTAFYFNGFAIAGLLLLPALQIYLNLTPIALDIPFYQWALLYSGFYATQLVLSMYTMGGLKLETLMLSAASFPIYIKASMNALRGRDESWQATNRVDSYDSPFNYIHIQVYIFTFLFWTTGVGVWKSMYTQEFSVSIAWCAFNAIIFGYFIYIARKESHLSRRTAVSNKRRRQNNKVTLFQEKKV